MYKVFYLTAGEYNQAVIMPGFKPAEFKTIEEAKAYILSQVREEDKVQPTDNTSSATICYEVYDRNPYNESGEIEIDPVYISEDYYYKP